MAKQIFVNLPVNDLSKSTVFYEALGFIRNPIFSNDSASCMAWSDEIMVMLLSHDFYKTFVKSKTIADSLQTSSVLLALSMDSKESVQEFADIAKNNGGSYYQVDSGVSTDMMFGYEVEDPDGHTWEPVWMNNSFQPHN